MISSEWVNPFKSKDISRCHHQSKCMMELLQFARQQGLEVTPDHLIDNPVPVSLDEARILKSKWALRWSLRRCRGCDISFNISEGGLYYLCHQCVEEAQE